MENKKKVEYIFRNIRDLMYKALGRDALSEDVINRYCSSLFGKKWQPVTISSEYVYRPNKLTIVNTSYKPHTRGSHWVSVATDNQNNLFFFDSYGRDARQIMPHFIARLPKTVTVVETENDMEQIGTTSQNCGQQSIAWLIVYHIVGSENAQYI
jgi:hypothetical protein